MPGPVFAVAWSRMVKKNVRQVSHICRSADVSHRLPGHLVLVPGCLCALARVLECWCVLEYSCCSCLSACRSADGPHRLPSHLALMLKCSCSRAHALVLLLVRDYPSVGECSCSSALVLVLRARARALVLVSCSCSSADACVRARVLMFVLECLC